MFALKRRGHRQYTHTVTHTHTGTHVCRSLRAWRDREMRSLPFVRAAPVSLLGPGDGQEVRRVCVPFGPYVRPDILQAPAAQDFRLLTELSGASVAGVCIYSNRRGALCVFFCAGCCFGLLAKWGYEGERSECGMMM